MQLVVDSLLVHYERAGKGKTIVMLHGWGDTAHGLKGLAQRLEKQYDVIRIDLPGFGGSESPPRAWGLDEYAGFIGEFCRKLGVAPFALLGHSNGGAIIVRGLANGTLTADRLILLASAGVRGEYKGRIKALRLATKAGKALTYPLPGPLKQRLRKKVYSTIGSDMLVAEHLQATFKRIVNDDVREDASQVRLPALLIYGTNDDATPPAWGKQLADRIAGSVYKEVPSAGHFVHLDQPQACLQLIEEFLR